MSVTTPYLAPPRYSEHHFAHTPTFIFELVVNFDKPAWLFRGSAIDLIFAAYLFKFSYGNGSHIQV